MGVCRERNASAEGAACKPARPRPLAVGVLSDTHGQLLPAVVQALTGVAHIVHAGDVGSPEVLAGLRALAPITAVRGNCDLGAWADSLPVVTEAQIGGARILVAHLGTRLEELVERVAQEERALLVAVSGHTHQAEVKWQDGVLYLNPGSAGPLRYGRPRTVARLLVYPGGQVETEVLRLS